MRLRHGILYALGWKTGIVRGVPYFYNDPDERIRFQRSTVSIPESITTPLVVLDEVQKIPQLFDPLKLVVDRERRNPMTERKCFVLTGSSQLLMMKGRTG